MAAVERHDLGLGNQERTSALQIIERIGLQVYLPSNSSTAPSPTPVDSGLAEQLRAFGYIE